jgi:hypothetical protein
MLLVPLLLAPAAMVAVSAAERRFGPAAAGWLNAFPLSIAVSIVAVTFDQDASAGTELAHVAATHVPAILALSVTWSAVLMRGVRRNEPRAATGPASPPLSRPEPAAAACALAGRSRLLVACGLLAGTGAFAVASFVLDALPGSVAAAAAVPALVFAPRMTPGGGGGAAAVGSGDVAVRAGAALVVVVAVLAAVRIAGPRLGGTVAAYPALTVVLAALIARARGPVAAAHALGGQVRGLAGYFAFCLVVSSGGSSLGLGRTVPLAFAACLVAGVASWARVPRLSPP